MLNGKYIHMYIQCLCFMSYTNPQRNSNSSGKKLNISYVLTLKPGTLLVPYSFPFYSGGGRQWRDTSHCLLKTVAYSS